jgi:hypothetical protein
MSRGVYFIVMREVPSRRVSSSVAVLVLALGLATACSSFSATETPAADGGTELDAASTSDGDAGGGDAGGEGGEGGSACSRAPFTAATINKGAVCGVGACRVVLSGICPVGGDGGSICSGAFGAEICDNGVDDDCDGVIDNGCTGAASNAGFECRGCAVGHNVKRNADGSLSGQLGTGNDYVTRAECVASNLCTLPGPAWVRNLAGAGVNCTQFCQAVGATCQPSCATEQGAGKCAPAAASVNQGGKTFGTYAADYSCMGASAGGTSTGVPNTGDCNFAIPDNGYGPVPDARFNVYCCCGF